MLLLPLHAVAPALAIAVQAWQAWQALLTLPALEELARPRVEEAAPIQAHPVHLGMVLEVPEHRTLNGEDILVERSGGAAPRATPKAARAMMGRPLPSPKNTY
jgi:hypothetical protein